MKISVCGRTDRGKRRPNNEDDLAMVDLTEAFEFAPPIDVEGMTVGDRGILLAVCDGVGGARAGEVASALALETLSHEMESLAAGCPLQSRFRAAVENVNGRVWQEAHTADRLHGMATTLTAAVVCHRRAIVAHVGDSRIYFLRGGSIQQLTRDQSLVASLVSCGAMTEEQAKCSPYRSTILQAIGRAATVEVALDGIDLEKGDILLLCTDGLSEKVRPDEMAGAFRSRSLSEGVVELIALANARGGEDNITVEAARVEE
jgi:serine/threonine protein phosphatase PrpC